MDSSRRAAGFTLVELLVVIAIISILAGLLLPALEEALTQARIVSCMSQQRQFHLALTGYADDWEQFLPPNYCTGNAEVHYIRSWNSGKYNTAWGNLTEGGYIEDPNLLYCPGREKHGETFASSSIATDYSVGWWYGQWDAKIYLGSVNRGPDHVVTWSEYSEELNLIFYKSTRRAGAPILAADVRARGGFQRTPTDVPHGGSGVVLLNDSSVRQIRDAFGEESPTQYLGAQAPPNGDRNCKPYHSYGREWWGWAENQVRQ